MLESLEPPSQIVSPLRTKSSSPKSQMSASASPMDLLKNPFLLPAHLLALNPNLYAAQLAQLQAAQLLFAKTQTSSEDNGLGPVDRKRSIDGDSPLDLGSRAAKYPRPESPGRIDGRAESNSESPLDLSGSKSPEQRRDSSFTPLLPPNLLSLLNQMQHKSQASPDLGKQSLTPAFPPFPGSPPSPPSRTSPWQSQWISKTSENTRIEDVFKCVWCRESYQTLEALTVHMKEAKHHAMPYPLSSPASSPLRPGQPRTSSPLRTSVSSPVSSMSTSPKPAPARDILKEQLPIPRKLVRGQDVWIGRADQQTKDILKCMSCGESFRSLELLTKHMQETQHYKKVISHDQISSWKFPESQQQPKPVNHVNSVLSCKVCDKGFPSLKDLSDHMVKANHYTVEAGKMTRNHPQPAQSQAAAVKDRKKALPVKKLLELERARHEVLGGASRSVNTARDILESGKLVCERCEEKIPLDFYIPHIQQCVGRQARFMSPASSVKSEGEQSEKSEAEKKPEQSSSPAHASILGSLEQLVKGNFQHKRSTTVTSPPTSSNNKFSIQNMFQKQESPAVSPSSSVVSPVSSRPSSQPSVMRESPAPDQSSNGGVDKIDNVDGMAETQDVSSPSNGDTNGDNHDEASDDKSETHDEDLDCPARSVLRQPDTRSPPPLVAKLSLAANEKEKKSGENPLAALQMLCDTQKKTPKTPKITEQSTSDPGSMMAFSWACNQANISGDSVIKCPFCDTPFISKGAYRHHLSKVHFTKESGSGVSLPASVRTPSPDHPVREENSLQNKYQKYAQLAKQLSCNQK